MTKAETTRPGVISTANLRRLILLAVAAMLVPVLGACADDAAPATSVASDAAPTTSILQQAESPTGPTPCAVPAAKMAADLGRSSADINGEHDCSGDWGWIDLKCDNPDPEAGCVHSGNIVHRVNGRWERVDALLQDCAESFTAHGASAADAENLFPRCFA